MYKRVTALADPEDGGGPGPSTRDACLYSLDPGSRCAGTVHAAHRTRRRRSGPAEGIQGQALQTRLFVHRPLPLARSSGAPQPRATQRRWLCPNIVCLQAAPSRSLGVHLSSQGTRARRASSPRPHRNSTPRSGLGDYRAGHRAIWDLPGRLQVQARATAPISAHIDSSDLRVPGADHTSYSLVATSRRHCVSLRFAAATPGPNSRLACNVHSSRASGCAMNGGDKHNLSNLRSVTRSRVHHLAHRIVRMLRSEVIYPFKGTTALRTAAYF